MKYIEFIVSERHENAIKLTPLVDTLHGHVIASGFSRRAIDPYFPGQILRLMIPFPDQPVEGSQVEMKIREHCATVPDALKAELYAAANAVREAFIEVKDLILSSPSFGVKTMRSGVEFCIQKLADFQGQVSAQTVEQLSYSIMLPSAIEQGRSLVTHLQEIEPGGNLANKLGYAQGLALGLEKKFQAYIAQP